MLAELPKLAIDEVTVYENSSSMFDEILAHRLGLLPIKTDLDLFVPREQCTCGGEGCPSCTAIYTLTKEGPGMVYSGDLQAANPNAPLVDLKVPIVKLGPGQRLMLEATAVMGKGKDHAKWQPVTAVGYKQHPVITINEKCNGCGACEKACPRQILKVKGGKVSVRGLEQCSLCGACQEACDQRAITVRGDENKVIFNYETDGSLTAKDAFVRSLGLLDDGLAAIQKGIEK
jgi:DNA-directed RNA polymerase subunit D